MEGTEDIELIDRIERRDVDELEPYENNPKEHPESQVAKIEKSIREYGFTVPVIVDEDGGIISGHGRIEAAKNLGMEEVPVIERGDLTEEQVRAFRIMDNRSAESPWDYEKLEAELADLDPDFDFQMTGFDEDEFEEMTKPPEPDVAKEPEVEDGYIVEIKVPEGKLEDVESLLDEIGGVEGVEVHVS